MRAIDEVKRLIEKIADGSLPADEPLFVLRAQDVLASRIVDDWIVAAERAGRPGAKVREAIVLSEMMRDWPIKQVPGRPESRVTQPTADSQWESEA